MNNRTALRIFGDQAVWVGLLLFTASLPLSRFGLSLGQFVIAGGWLLGEDVKNKFLKAVRQPVVWVLWGVFFLSVLGLWNTSNFNTATDDLRIKLPLILLPLFLSSIKPLTGKQYRIILFVFVLATLISTLISLGIYLGWSKIQVENIRDITPFLSHIRLSLMVCFSIVCLAWFIFQIDKLWYRLLAGIIICWFIAFLILLESLTGLSILISGTIIMIVGEGLKKNTRLPLRVACSVLVFITIIGTGKLYHYIFIESIRPINFQALQLPERTALGHLYEHKTNMQDLENGNPVFLYLNTNEMDSVWKKRTGESIFRMGAGGVEEQYTLMRFLSSKGLTKDAAGVSSLNDDEILAIKKGIANANDLTDYSFKKRIRSLAWEYRQYYFTKNPSGHSLTMRLEFWRAGIFIFKQHPLTGVGTGDLKEEYNKAYDEIGSKIDYEWRLVAHNEYLRMAVLFGIPGFLYFIFSLLYPWHSLNKRKDLLYTAFLFIACCSMLAEDTIETQTGVSFFAFLNSFLLFNSSTFTENIEEKNLNANK